MTTLPDISTGNRMRRTRQRTRTNDEQTRKILIPDERSSTMKYDYLERSLKGGIGPPKCAKVSYRASSSIGTDNSYSRGEGMVSPSLLYVRDERCLLRFVGLAELDSGSNSLNSARKARGSSRGDTG